MGVDIRLVVEYAEIDQTKQSVEDLMFMEFAEIHLGRSSAFFSLLAGVRGNEEAVIEPRGLPKNISDSVKSKCLLKVDTNVVVPTNLTSSSYKVVEVYTGMEVIGPEAPEQPSDTGRISARRRTFYGDSSLVYNEDYYSHSWLLLPELREVYAKTLKNRLFSDLDPSTPKIHGSEAILSLMESLEKEEPVITRVVFWFNG